MDYISGSFVFLMTQGFLPQTLIVPCFVFLKLVITNEDGQRWRVHLKCACTYVMHAFSKLLPKCACFDVKNVHILLGWT